MNRQNALLKTAALTFAACMGVVCSCTASSQHAGHDHAAAAAGTGKSATAVLKGKDGSKVNAKVVFKEGPDGVKVVAHIEGVEGGGVRGFHLHEVGDCTPPDFTSAGSHFNPTGAPHGAPTAPQHHAGDLGNVTIGADGGAHYEIISRGLTVGPGPNSVVGRSVILHEKADDMTTQPTGNAGGRVACGVVKADA
jgi:Cu-Zn family superoxide dismutase